METPPSDELSSVPPEVPEELTSDLPPTSPQRAQPSQAERHGFQGRSTAAPSHFESQPSPPVDPDDLRSVLRAAFRLPADYQWVSDFLFQEEAGPLDIPNLVSGVQKASAALVDFLAKEGKGDLEDISEDDDSRGNGQKTETDRFCLIPLMSRNHITLGFYVRQVPQAESDHESEYRDFKNVPCAKFAFDNSTTAIIFVALKDSRRSSKVIAFSSNDAKRGRFISCFSFQDGEIFQRMVGDDRGLTDVINSVTLCVSLSEDRSTCISCTRSLPSSCTCSHQTHIPLHPLDFSVFARNMVLYAGSFSAKLLKWKREQNQELTISQPSASVSCRISVSVNHERVSALCALAIASIGAVEQVDHITDHGSMPQFYGEQIRSQQGVDVGADERSLSGQGQKVQDQDVYSSSPLLPNVSSPLRRKYISLTSKSVCKSCIDKCMPCRDCNSTDNALVFTASSFHAGTESLRKLRNRESAARSNLRRKEKLQNLRESLQEAKKRLEQVEEQEQRLRKENADLRRKLSSKK